MSEDDKKGTSEMKEMNEMKKSNESELELKKNKKVKWSVPNAIEIVSDELKNSELRVSKNSKYLTAMERLQDYFKTNETQTWILVINIIRGFENCRSGLDLDDIASYIGCGIMKIVSWMNDVKKLIDLGYLSYRDRDEWDCISSNFVVADEILQAIASNTTFTLEKETEEIDYVTFLHRFANKYENREREEKSTRRMIYELHTYETENKELEFIEQTRKVIEERDIRFLFYDMCNDFLTGHDSAMDRTISDLYDSTARFRVAKEMMDEIHPLFKKGLIEFTKKGNLRDATLSLTEKGKQLLLGEDADLFEQHLDEKLLIVPDKIAKKTLYYSEENEKQISRLREALTGDKLSEIQTRLKESGMPVGLAVLLFGGPGTGKTESVYQIAKDTGRAIVHVDISDSKSCWFGESEKKIKQVFTRYKHMCEIAKKTSGKMPILMFNEADAIFAKRKDNSTGNVVQTENAIQNIILEEMETLQGILIATTNLATNLDPAFERRFLFKIQFEHPSIQAKKSIWLGKLSWLSDEDAEKFAKTYELSGGQIDNIVRKITMNEVITGQRPEIYEIDDMCVSEKLNRDEFHKVGFAC